MVFLWFSYGFPQLPMVKSQDFWLLRHLRQPFPSALLLVGLEHTVGPTRRFFGFKKLPAPVREMGDGVRWRSITPIGSMYGIYANIWGILMVNVTIYTIHGSYGIWFRIHWTIGFQLISINYWSTIDQSPSLQWISNLLEIFSISS